MSTPKLFQPIKLGNATLQHRIVLAPMTRLRNTADFVPLPIVKEYYAQRGSTPGTLLISESVQIAPPAGGIPNVPGIWSDAQIAAWKEARLFTKRHLHRALTAIADAVHEKGSFLFLQLWAAGRGAVPAIMKAQGFDYVAPSAIKASEDDETPRALTQEEIKQYVEWHAQAATNAIKAGVDGVEIHCANAFLIDQFLQDVSNARTDKYGGSIENRARFGLEVINAVVKAIGAERTAIRLSPWDTSKGLGMQDPIPQFRYFVEQIKAAHPALAYIHVVEPRVAGLMTVPPEARDASKSNDFLRAVWAPRPLISCGAYSRELALEIADAKGDLIAVGRQFVSNPDLPERWKHNWELSPYNRDLFYVPGEPKGYIDYPFATDEQKQKKGDIVE
ncbi:hypothetical protein HDZ31DRAFT_40373 [Schizophyllum fasciatum]